MNALFAANDLAYSGLELAVYTLLHHNPNTNIYVFTMTCIIINPQTGEAHNYYALQDWQRGKLQKIVQYLGKGKANLVIKDVTELYLKYLDNSVNRYTGFTPLASLRLLADIALPNVNNLWYFDCDVAITGDISSYYNYYSQKDCLYGAYVAQDACDGKGEMITGVMFMNLKKMRDTKFLEQARYNYNHNLYEFPDQMAIRDTGDPEIFPSTLGYCDDLYECLELPLIIHFTNLISLKIYFAKSREYFFRKFPFLKYAQEGIDLLDTINM